MNKIKNWIPAFAGMTTLPKITTHSLFRERGPRVRGLVKEMKKVSVRSLFASIKGIVSSQIPESHARAE